MIRKILLVLIVVVLLLTVTSSVAFAGPPAGVFDCGFVDLVTITCNNRGGNTVIECSLGTFKCINHGGITILDCRLTGATITCKSPGNFECVLTLSFIPVLEIINVSCGPG